jgi:hypothetical protein
LYDALDFSTDIDDGGGQTRVKGNGVASKHLTFGWRTLAERRVSGRILLRAKPCHAHFSLKVNAPVISLVLPCISVAPAMLDRYLAA